MERNIAVPAVMATVAIVILATIMIPVIGDTADNLRGHKEYVNTKSGMSTELAAGDHIVWTPTQIEVNGSVITGGRTSENWLKAQNILGAIDHLWIYRGENTITHLTGLSYADITFDESMTPTIVYETAATTDPTTITGVSNDWGFVVANKGDWVQIRFDSPEAARSVYVNNLDQVYTSGPAGGLVSSKGTTAWFKGVEYDNGIAFTSVTDLGDGVLNVTYSLTTVIYTDEITGLPVDQVRVIVIPAIVENNPGSSTTADMLEIIPLMVLIGVIVSVIGFAVYRTRE